VLGQFGLVAIETLIGRGFEPSQGTFYFKKFDF